MDKCFHYENLNSRQPCFAGKPVITYDDKLREAQVVKTGASLILSVNITGAPVPKVTWYCGKEQVSATNGISIESTDSYSTLTVKGVEDSQGGLYSVLAENEAGNDKAEFTVNIRGLLHVVSSTH